MEFLYFLEKIRVPILNELMLAVTTLGEETAFLVIALIVFWCVDKIVKIEGREIIDWQLMPWEKVNEALAGEIKEGLIYAVLSAASLSELRKNKEIQWRCRCDRSKCPQCWLEYTFYQQNDTP